MKDMKPCFLFVGLLSLIAVSCTLEESIVPADNGDNTAAEFYAMIDERSDTDTKVYSDDKLRVLWNEDDRITVFNKNTFNQQYRFTGKNGENAGGFKIVEVDQFITAGPLDCVYAVYPYLESNKISNDGIINTVIPSEQTYTENSFGIGANTMAAVAEGKMLKFKNIGGYLSLKFYGEGVSVSSISLQSNNGELIAGNCTVDMSSGTPVSSLLNARATDRITLVCESPVELGSTSSNATQFIFVLSPVSLASGFTVTITTPDGAVFEKSSANKVVIGRSAITRVGAMKVAPNHYDGEPIGTVADAVDLGLSVKWASWNVGGSKIEDYGGLYGMGDETGEKTSMDFSDYYYGESSLCGTEYDLAHIRWGGQWRLPTRSELDELANLCSWKDHEINGVKGLLGTGPSGATIFLPFAGVRRGQSIGERGYEGHYWSGDQYSDIHYNGYYDFDIREGIGIFQYDGCESFFGQSIRPVYDDPAIDLSAGGTSNSYIAPLNGYYRFNAGVRGNSTTPVGVPATVTVLWETFNTHITPSAGSIVKDVKLENGEVFFRTTNEEGNALIAVKNGSGEVLWSWHIWATDYNPDEEYNVYQGSDVKVMDRNLGALSNQPGDPRNLGFYYQWGRKDPFPSSSNTDQYVMIATYPSSVFSTIDRSDSTGTVDYTVKNPTVSITEGYKNSTHDWASQPDSGLWGESKTEYDPCPVGWKVPEASVFTPLARTSDYVRDTDHRGVLFGETVSTPSAFFPCAGNNPGGVLNGGEFSVSCHYWTTSLSGTYYSRRFCVYENSEPSTGYLSYRSHGFPVRCRRE